MVDTDQEKEALSILSAKSGNHGVEEKEEEENEKRNKEKWKYFVWDWWAGNKELSCNLARFQGDMKILTICGICHFQPPLGQRLHWKFSFEPLASI